MFRKAISDLVEWKSSKRRKPLIIRGPRQAGKTWLVRDFAKREFENLIEINFDQTPDKSKFLTNPSIERCLELIEVDSGRELIPEKTLLFLDEIQAAPDALPRLRYFYEERPDIPIVAAGSLLEFLLADHDFSMPVGRVEYLHLGPMDFEEFLMARGKKKLVEFLERFSVEEEIPDSIHAGLLDELRLFWVVGGMPAPVKSFLESGGTREMASEHESLLQTYEDDFSKYRDRVDPERLQTVLRKIPGLIGNKLKYSRIDPEDRAKNLSDALKQLEKARVLHRVFHSSGNGVPLGAEADDSDFKALFLDIGLVSTS
ncbi:MAG: ATP-binding protein, partial [Candidatus Omnitrophica bacterium]|nr:ATP-binding protein [Candidatus Omnitrophota bacterium]